MCNFYKFDLLKEKLPILIHFINHNEDLEFEALDSIQNNQIKFSHTDFPDLFQMFFNENLIGENAFIRWKLKALGEIEGSRNSSLVYFIDITEDFFSKNFPHQNTLVKTSGPYSSRGFSQLIYIVQSFQFGKKNFTEAIKAMEVLF